MLVTFFIIACLVQGLVFSQEENDCENLFPEEKYEEAGGIPDAEELASMCPDVMRYIQCKEEESYVNYEGEDSKSYLDSNKDLMTDMCNNTSRLYEAYMNSVECYRNMVDEWPSCRKIGQEVYLDFYRLTNNIEGEIDEDYLDLEEKESYDGSENFEPICLITAHSISCISIKILESCGSEAHETYVELVRRSKFLYYYCTRTTASTLRKEFFEFLKFNKEEEQIDIFRSMFEYRKK